jgi:hypothetical protein
MSAIAFDTHAFIKRLTAVGMPESQAEVLAEEQTKLIETQLATKADIADVRRDIEIARHELTVRVGAMIVALGGFLAAIKFIGH